MFEVFVRDWWKIENGKKVPAPEAEKEHLAYADSELEARTICKNYNFENEAGVLSRKAEYREI